MADCINDDNEIDLQPSTNYYSGKDPLFKQGKEGTPVNGLSLSYGDLNSPDEIDGVSEIKKCKPLDIGKSLIPESEPVKCDIKTPEEEPMFATLTNTIISLFKDEQKSVGATVIKSIITSVTIMFILFLIYRGQLYSLSNLKSLLFTFIFLFKRFFVFATILFLLSLTYNVIFSFIPYFIEQFTKFLLLSINPLSDEDINKNYNFLSDWIIIPHVYLVSVVSYFIFITTLIGAFIVLILLPLIVILGYFVGIFLSFMS